MTTDVAKRLIGVAVLALVAAARSGRASVMAGDGVLDQEHVVSYSPLRGFAWGIENPWDVAQTFTVGLSGQLSRLELQVWGSNRREGLPPYSLVVSLRRTRSNGSPDTAANAVLATVTIPPSAVSHSFFTDVFWGADLGDQAFPVEAGQRIAIVIATPLPAADPVWGDYYAWGVSNWKDQSFAVDYPGGIGFRKEFGSSGSLVPHPNEDAGFRTFVSVPEPAALLAIAPAAFLLLCRRVRRNSHNNSRKTSQAVRLRLHQ